NGRGSGVMAIERLEPGWRGGPDASGGGTRLRVGFDARPGLTWLLIKNFLLTIVTLGFYRFWARVRVRRYFWSSLRLADEPLEYTGTGLELFVGFLIAVAVIAPFGIAYVVLKRISLGNPFARGAIACRAPLGAASARAKPARPGVMSGFSS